MLTDIVGMTEDEIAGMRAAPNWPERVATAPTIAREARIEDGWDWQPDRGHRCSNPRRPGARPRRPRPCRTHRYAPAVVAEVLRNWLK